MTTDPTPAATARDALLALHDFLWDEMEWFSDESAPMPRYTTMAHGQKHDDLVERFHDAYPELLAAAEAPGRVAALETALRSIAAKEPAPAIPGCTCDPDSATDDDGNLVMCDLHEPMLRHLRWETLASLVIDYHAFMRHALAVADAALAAAEAPGRVAALEAALGIAYDLTRPEPKMSGPHYRTIGPVTAQRIHEAIVDAIALAAPAPTPSEPVARCGFTTDGFRCNDTPLQHRYLCGLLHSHTFLCHPFTPGARDE